MCNICQIFVKYLSNICWIFVKYLSNIWQIIVKYLWNICEIFVKYFSNILNLLDQLEHRRQLIFQDSQNQTICEIFVEYLSNICQIFETYLTNLNFGVNWFSGICKTKHFHVDSANPVSICKCVLEYFLPTHQHRQSCLSPIFGSHENRSDNEDVLWKSKVVSLKLKVESCLIEGESWKLCLWGWKLKVVSLKVKVESCVFELKSWKLYLWSWKLCLWRWKLKVVSLKVKVVKEIWTEEDEGGQVRFATVQVNRKIWIHY